MSHLKNKLSSSALITVKTTFLGGLLFADQYIQIATFLPTGKIYGFGEHAHQNLKVRIRKQDFSFRKLRHIYETYRICLTPKLSVYLAWIHKLHNMANVGKRPAS